MNLNPIPSSISLSLGAIAVSVFAQGAIVNPSQAIDFSSFSPVGDAVVTQQGFQLSNNSLNDDDAQSPLPDSAFNFSGSPAVDENTLTNALTEFNTGDFDGSNPFFDVATQGSVIESTLNVVAGETISFDWTFLTNENVSAPINGTISDYAFVAINGSIEQLIEVQANQGSFTASGTTYNLQLDGTFSHTFTTNDTINLTIGVVDIGDAAVSSAFVSQPIPFGISTNQSAVVLLGGVSLILWRRYGHQRQRNQ